MCKKRICTLLGMGSKCSGWQKLLTEHKKNFVGSTFFATLVNYFAKDMLLHILYIE